MHEITQKIIGNGARMLIRILSPEAHYRLTVDEVRRWVRAAAEAFYGMEE